MSAAMRALAESPPAIRGIGGQLVTGVSIVTTLAGEELLATTVGSLVVASWDPPLLALFCQTGSRLDVALGQSGRFTVNLLGEADHGLARRFAHPGRGQGWAAFAGVPLRRRDPAPPVVLGAAAWADCAVARALPIGDHRCYVGALLEAERDETVAPLAYHRGRFRGLGTAVAPVAWATAGAVDRAAVW